MSTSDICICCNKRKSVPLHDYCRECWLDMIKPADEKFHLKSRAINAENANAELGANITHLKMLIELAGERENKLKVQLAQSLELMVGWEKLARERGARWVKLEEAIPEIHSALELKMKMEELEKDVGGELNDGEMSRVNPDVGYGNGQSSGTPKPRDRIFHDHIKSHFEKEHPEWEVICKICNRTYNDIVNSDCKSPDMVRVADGKDDEELPQGEQKSGEKLVG